MSSTYAAAVLQDPTVLMLIVCWPMLALRTLNVNDDEMSKHKVIFVAAPVMQYWPSENQEVTDVYDHLGHLL